MTSYLKLGRRLIRPTLAWRLVPLLALGWLLAGCQTGAGVEISSPYPTVDLKGSLSEDFDWPAYFSAGEDSISDDMMHADAAAACLGIRLNELCAQYRALLTKRGDNEALKLFDEMQAAWLKSANAEVAFVGSAWNGGSGERAAYPEQRFKAYLRRVKELKELKGDCLCLNE